MPLFWPLGEIVRAVDLRFRAKPILCSEDIAIHRYSPISFIVHCFADNQRERDRKPSITPSTSTPITLITALTKLSPLFLGSAHLLQLLLSKPASYCNPLSTPVKSLKLDRIRAFRGRHAQPRSQSQDVETRKSSSENSPSPSPSHSHAWFRKMRRSASATKRGRSPTDSPPTERILSPKRQERASRSEPVSRDTSLTRDHNSDHNSAHNSELVPPLPKMPAFLQLIPEGK